ncbi:MAG TPA: hypothetical protein VFV75_12290 [Candidatus Polarisedimenticolaceae bacterium]|nr:hypothetical protein [Candidatus Polarisedimenticolaceae bacterium]
MFWIIALILVVFSFATQGLIQVLIFLTVAGMLIGVARKRSLRLRVAAAGAAKEPSGRVDVDRSRGGPENEVG